MTEQVKCVVCGKTTEKAKALTIQHVGQMYYVCGPGCKNRFTKSPTKYAKVAPTGPTPTTPPKPSGA